MSKLNHLPARMRALVLVLPFAFAACTSSEPTSPLSPVATSAAHDRGDDDSRGSPFQPTIYARALIVPAGGAIVDVSTAAFDVTPPVPNGTLARVDYKLIDPSQKVRYVGSIDPRIPATRLLDTIPTNLDDKKAVSTKHPAVVITTGWTLSVQAQVLGAVPASCLASRPTLPPLSSPPTTAELLALWNAWSVWYKAHPDCIPFVGHDDDLIVSRLTVNARPAGPAVGPGSLDLAASAISRILPAPVGASDFINVPKDSTVTYVTTFTNRGPVGGEAMTATCTATIDGVAVTTTAVWVNGTGTQAGVISIPSASSRDCQVNAAIGTLGSHTLVITAVSATDKDNSNNSATKTFEVVASGVPDGTGDIGGGFPPPPPPVGGGIYGFTEQWTEESWPTTTDPGPAAVVLAIRRQNARVNSLVTTINAPITGNETFTIQFQGLTGKLNPSGQPLLNEQRLTFGTWTDTLSRIIALAPNPSSVAVYQYKSIGCISASQRPAVLSNMTNVNGGAVDAFLCVDLVLPGDPDYSAVVVRYHLTAGYFMGTTPAAVNPDPATIYKNQLAGKLLYDDAFRFQAALAVGTLGTSVNLDAQVPLDLPVIKAPPKQSTNPEEYVPGANAERRRGWTNP